MKKIKELLKDIGVLLGALLMAVCLIGSVVAFFAFVLAAFGVVIGAFFGSIALTVKYFYFLI